MAHPITNLARWIVRAGGVGVSFRPPTQEVGGSIPVSASSAAFSAGLLFQHYKYNKFIECQYVLDLAEDEENISTIT